MILRDRRDYGEDGKDQLEKNYSELPSHQKKLIKEQFKGRVSMDSEKIAVSHYKEKKSEVETDDVRVAQIVDQVIGIAPVQMVAPVTESDKKYSTTDTLRSSDGNYIIIKTNYDEKNGDVILEEYTVEKNGKVDTYDNTNDFAARLMAEGLL